MKSVGQAEQAVGGTEQTRTQQHRQCREHAAVSDGVGGRGEHRLGLGHQAGAGEHAALDVTSRAAHGRVLVAGVAGGTIGSRRRVGLSSVRAGGVIGGRNRLRSVRDGGGRPCGVGDDAGAPVFVKPKFQSLMFSKLLGLI